jgi:non-specific serine/threonine protein kinase
MANLALDQGDYERARRVAEECLALAREDGFAVHIAPALSHLGVASLRQGDIATARSRLEESLALFRELNPTFVAGSLRYLAEAALQTGDDTRARSLLVESLSALREWEDREMDVVGALEVFAALAVARGWPTRALRLAGAAEALRRARHIRIVPAEQAELDRRLKTARQALGEEGAAAAWTNGQALSLEQAVAYALTDHVD